MKLNIVPARAGLQWVRIGIRTYLRQPMALTSLFMLLVLSSMLLSAVPVIGLLLFLTASPAASLAMMVAARATILAPAGPRLALLVPTLREVWASRSALLQLGMAQALLGVLALLATSGLAGLDLPGRTGTDAQAQAQLREALPGLLAFFAVYSATQLLMAQAAGLAHWHRVPVKKALFFALVAGWRNLGAFALFGLGWLGAILPVALVLGLFASVLGLAGVPGSAFLLAAFGGLQMGVSLVFATLVATSVFFSFHDCFHQPAHDEATPHEPSAPPSPPDEPQRS